MKGITDWFLYKYFSYIRVYGTTGAPHFLPYFILDHLLMKEISYQTMGLAVTSLLLIRNKNLYPIFPMHIGIYTIYNNSHERNEIEILQEL
jgi:hypothetical protein